MAYTAKITKSRVDHCLPASAEYMLWDEELRGFGLRVFPSGRKTYFIQYRVGRRTRRLKLGSHGHLTPDEARKLAKKELGSLAHGLDPARERQRLKNSLTVSQLCDLYVLQGCATKKPSTLATDKGRIERHIKPLLGGMIAREVTRNDAEKFLKDVASGKSAADLRTKPRGRARVTGGKGTASRTVGLLGAIFTFAQHAGLRSDNPIHGVKRFPDRRCERFLDPLELRTLGRAIQSAEESGLDKSAGAALRFLAMTGCRRGEALGLRWGNINRNSWCLILPDSKTGHKIVPVGEAVFDLLDRLDQGKSDQFVFLGQSGDRTKRLQIAWECVRTAAGLPNVRLHDLRHTFVSAGVNAGEPLAVMGKLVGHGTTETTARYAHLAKGAANLAANRVSEAIADALS